MRDAERLRYLLLAAQREGNRRLLSELRPLGLTPSQAEVLRVLGDHAPLTLTGLGGLLVCESGTNPSRLVDRLVTAGLVDRSSGAVDRREVHLVLTDRGFALERDVAVIEERLYSDLDAAGATEGILRLLESLVEGMPSGIAYNNRVAARQSQPAGERTASP